METVRDVVTRAGASEGEAFAAGGRDTAYSSSAFATSVWKAGHLLHHYGAGPDRPVAVAVGPKAPDQGAEPGWLGDAADPLYAMLGGASVGAPVDPAPEGSVDAPVLVAPDDWLDRFDPAPGTTVLAYGGPPSDPGVGHFERERWSENPVEPPEPLEPDRTALRANGRPLAHADLLAATTALLDRVDVAEATAVRVNAPVTDPAAFVAGVLAPLSTGTTIRPVVDGEPDDPEITLEFGDDEWDRTVRLHEILDR